MNTDAELMTKLVTGDQTALEILYARHRGLLYSVALRIMEDSASAEELLQDTFVQLWKKAALFDTARGSLIGWLLAMIRHRAIDRIRSNRIRFKTQPFFEETIALEWRDPPVLTHQIANQLISKALGGLPVLQLQAITLAYFEGLTCEEIATRIRTPLGTVKSRLRIGLKTMKRNISNQERMAAPEPSHSISLQSVLITEQLSSRICKRRPPQEEANSLLTLAQTAASSPSNLVDCFLEMPIALCGAGTAGLSLLETNASGQQEFRWTNLAGKLANSVGGTTPRNFSPCGVTLDRNSPQLFAYPGRYFKYFNKAEFPIVEGLVIPFNVGKTKGTVWIVSHDERTKFNSEDARVMSTLAEFAGCAIHLGKSFDARVD